MNVTMSCPMDMVNGMLRLIPVVALMILAGCSGGSVEPAAKIQTASFGEDVFSTYTERDYPRVTREWGSEGIRLIELAERNAAKVAAHSGKCDSISYVGLAESRSVAPTKPVAFVDCNNGERFYASLGDAPGTVKAQSDRAVGKDVARAECLDKVRASESFPSSVKFGLGSTVVNDHKTTGGISVTVDYTAKNSIGIEVPRSGRCLFPTDGPPDVETVDR